VEFVDESVGRAAQVRRLSQLRVRDSAATHGVVSQPDAWLLLPVRNQARPWWSAIAFTGVAATLLLGSGVLPELVAGLAQLFVAAAGVNPGAVVARLRDASDPTGVLATITGVSWLRLGAVSIVAMVGGVAFVSMLSGVVRTEIARTRRR